MAFDTAAAQKAGYSALEIAEFLGNQKHFDTAAAIAAGYSPEELISHLSPRESTIGSELVRGAKQLGSSLQTGIGALLGSPEAAAQAGLERGQAIGEAAGEGPSLAKTKQAYEDGGVFGAAKEVASQIPRAIAGQIPQMGAMAAGARLGAMAGSPLGPYGVVGGGILGAGATLLPSFFGSDIERQAAEQEKAGQPIDINRGRAALAASGQAALEGAGTAFTLGKRVVKGVLGIADDVALQTVASRAALEATAKRSLLATTAQGVARGLAVEIPVEIAQQIIERAQAGLDLTSPDALNEYGETAYQTGLSGGPFGAAGRIYERGGARGELAKEEAGIQEAGAAERRARQAAQREAAAQQISGVKGEKILDAEAAEQAKLDKAQEKVTQQTMQDDYAQRRAEREAELKEAFPSDYSDVMSGANRYGVLAIEKASLEGERKTTEIRSRLNAIDARLADIAAEDDRIPNEFLRMQRDQIAAAKAAGFPARKAAAVFAGTYPVQTEMREAMAPGQLPAQTDLFGKPLVSAGVQPEGLATVAEAELPLTTDVLQTAGLAPTTKELEAAGQTRFPFRRTPAGQPASPLPTATPVATEVVKELPVVETPAAAPAQPGAITATEVRQFGTMAKANRDWLSANIEGRTPEQVRDMVAANPNLLAPAPVGLPVGLQVAIKEIVASATPKVDQNVQPPITPTPEVKPVVRAGRGEPSVAVPVQPAGNEPVVAGAAPTPSAAEPAPPVGRGLVSPEQPAVAGVTPEVGVKPALDAEEVQRKAEADAVIAALAKVRKEAQAPKVEAAPAPAPKPAKAEPKAEAPAPAPTGSPFEILSKIQKRQAEQRKAAAAPTPAKAEVAPAKAEVAPAKAEVTPAKAAPAPEVKKAQDKVDQKIEDLRMDADATKGQVKAVAKTALTAGLIDSKAVAEIERISKDRDMGPEDMLDELSAALESGPAPVKAEAPVPAPAKAALAKVKLTEPEVKKLEDHYGLGRTSDGFWAKIQDDVVALTNQGLKAVDVAIRKIIQKLAAGVMSVAVLFNPAGLSANFDFNLPQTYKTTTTVQVKANVPTNAKAKMSTLAQSVYESMAPTAKASGKAFIIADKPNGMLHAFLPDGSMLVQDAALYGKDSGDVESAISSLKGGTKITPAGTFTLGATADADYAGGMRLDLKETNRGGGVIAVHAAYLGDPKEQRLVRLASPSAFDNRISYGCVNTSHETFLQYIVPNIEAFNGGMIFVLPDAQAATAAMFPAKTETTTLEGVEQTAKGETGRDLVAKEAERPPEAAKVKIGEAPSKGRASGAVAEGQSIGSLRGEILRGKGMLYSALRRAIDSGKVVLETKDPKGNNGGYFDGRIVTLYADGIPSGQALAVALHEVGAHMGFKNLFGARVYDNIIKQIQQTAANSKNSVDRALAQSALDRIPEADKARGAEVYGDETIAYFIEEAIKAQAAGTLPTSGPIRALLNNIRLAMLAAINRVFGSKLGVANLSTDDILSMAKGAFVRESFSAIRGTAEKGASRASKTQRIDDILTDMGREMPVEDTRPLLTRAADAIKEAVPKKIEGVGMIQRIADMAADQLDAGEPLMRELRKEIRATLPATEANEALVALSSSQASHDGGLAAAALEDGGITYDDAISKFVTEKSEFNRKAVHEVYARMAKLYGMTLPQARYATSTALESKRMLALYDTRETMLANAEVLKASGNTAAATKMREKAEGYIFHMTRAQVEKGMELFQAVPEINEVERLKEGMRGWIRTHLQDTGVWSEETGQWMLDNAEWVPFNREAVETADADVEAGGFNAYVRGLQVKAKEKAFKGSMREVHDVMDNFENWADYSVRRGILNKKATDLATASLQYLPESEARAVKTPMRNASDRTVSYLVNGEPKYVEFDSAAKAQIFKGSPAMAQSALPVIGGLVDSLNSVFRGAILNFPLFPIYQLAMDSISAVYLSGLSPKYAYKIPVLAVKEAIATFRETSTAYDRLRSVGAVGVHDYNATLSAANADVIDRMKSMSGWEKYVAVMHKMNLVADNAVRQSVYLAARDSGLSEAAAVEKAFEIINFRTRVGNTKLAAAARNVVFLNSFFAATRVALKVLSNEGISPTERAQARKMLISNMAWLAGLSFMMAMANIGDDDYEKMSRQEQAGKLTLPGLGGWGIPLRPDVFMLVKVMAEMVARQGFSEFADDPAKVRATVSDAVANALLSGPVPVAQPIKVAVELATNHSFFTGRALVGRGLETQESFRQFSAGTSELAKGIGVSAKNLVELTGLKSEGLSPVKIDHIIQGMLGMYGGALILATNSMVNGRPTQSMQDTIASLPGMGRIGVKEFDSQIKADFFDLAQTVHKAVDTANRYKAQGMGEEYRAYVTEKKDLIKYGSTIQSIERNLSGLRKTIAAVSANRNLTPTERDSRILELRKSEKRMMENLAPLIKKMRTEALA